jgi:O-methyltransferase
MPKILLEIGFFTGYTMLIMDQALADTRGKVVALDHINNEYVSIGKPYWEKAGVLDHIQVILGPAVESLQKMIPLDDDDDDDDKVEEKFFDFIFIDADKLNYKKYYELSLQLLQPNGIIAIDNTLWGVEVLDYEVNDPDTTALREITKLVHTDTRVEHVLLPFADGVTLVRKK